MSLKRTRLFKSSALTNATPNNEGIELNKPKFGAAIPQDQWIQRTATTDPNPRMPFSGIYYQDEIKMPFFEHLIAGTVFGFAIGAIIFS